MVIQNECSNGTYDDVTISIHDVTSINSQLRFDELFLNNLLLRIREIKSKLSLNNRKLMTSQSETITSAMMTTTSQNDDSNNLLEENSTLMTPSRLMTSRISIKRNIKRNEKSWILPPTSGTSGKSLRHHRGKMDFPKLLMFLLLLSEIVLSSVVALGPNAFCAALSDLTRTQRRLCQKKPTVISAVSRGAAMAREECNYQFRDSRWNCQHNRKKGGMFGTSLNIPSKETAFDCAISAAGILHSVVTECANGEIRDCGCADMRNKRNRIRRQPILQQKGGQGVRKEVVSKWQWGGCSVDLTFGLHYTTEFTTGQGSRYSAKILMNRHNYEAGRQIVKNNLRMMCRCHGISGACTLHTCWKALPNFRTVGDLLKTKFDKAVHVTPAYIEESSTIPRALVTTRSKRQSRKPHTESLVYIAKSPNFCRKNDKVGSLGTKGRRCNVTSTGDDGCDKLCCGRGHKVKEQVITEKCNCRFFWCCYVTCEECQTKVKIYTCK